MLEGKDAEWEKWTSFNAGVVLSEQETQDLKDQEVEETPPTAGDKVRQALKEHDEKRRQEKLAKEAAQQITEEQRKAEIRKVTDAWKSAKIPLKALNLQPTGLKYGIKVEEAAERIVEGKPPKKIDNAKDYGAWSNIMMHPQN